MERNTPGDDSLPVRVKVSVKSHLTLLKPSVWQGYPSQLW